jgi:hypothetical protein
MTSITLTAAQKRKVLASNPVEVPAIAAASDFHNTNVAGVWGIGLSEMHHFYSNKHIVNPAAVGTIIEIIVPHLRRDHILAITDVQDERNRHQFMRYGRISTHPDFDHDVISEHTWGIGGHVEIHLGPAATGKRFFFCHRIAEEAERHNHWYSTLQMVFR